MSVTVRAPAKINLDLAVGPAGADGFHELVTVFLALDLYDDVTVTPAPDWSCTVTGRQAGEVPQDASNLAVRAAQLLAGRYGVRESVAIAIDKDIPVAGGMAGGSADAAATLVACNDLWGCGADDDALAELAAELGSDVAFPLIGGTAIGTGRGHLLEPIAAAVELTWVLAFSPTGLSTPAVFRECDRLRAQQRVDVLAPQPNPPLLAALAAGDAAGVGRALRNDLQAAAVSLQPALAQTLAAGRAAGALGGLVSGSGPTTAFLAADDNAADRIAAALSRLPGVSDTAIARGPVSGATVLVGD